MWILARKVRLHLPDPRLLSYHPEIEENVERPRDKKHVKIVSSHK